MFPITDFSRVTDIRMRRRRAFWLLIGIVLVPTILFSGHGSRHHRPVHDDVGDLDIDLSRQSIRSDSLPATEMESVLRRIPLIGGLNWTIRGAPLPDGRRDAAALSAAGSSLRVDLPCAGSITLVPQQDRPGRVFVSSRDGRPPGETGVRLSDGPALAVGGTCRPGDLDLVVQAPASMPLTLVQSGSAGFRLGAFSGPVHLIQAGSGDTVIDAAGPLDIEHGGQGDLSIGRLDGPLRLSSAGSGDVAIAHIQADHVQITGMGSGDFSISDGRIDRLDATLRGTGDLSVGAEIGDASVQSSNNSDITLPHVRGHFVHTILDD